MTRHVWDFGWQHHYEICMGTWNDRRVVRQKLKNAMLFGCPHYDMRYHNKHPMYETTYDRWHRYYEKAIKHQNGFGKDLLCAYMTGKTTERRAPGECEKVME
jgi:hypothetical protein